MPLSQLKLAQWSETDSQNLLAFLQTATGDHFLQQLCAAAPSSSKQAASDPARQLGKVYQHEVLIELIKALSQVVSTTGPIESETYPDLDDDSKWDNK